MNWRPPLGWREAMVGRPAPTVKVTTADHRFRFWEPDGTEIRAVGEPIVYPVPRPQEFLAPQWSSWEVEMFLSLCRPQPLTVITNEVMPL